MNNPETAGVNYLGSMPSNKTSNNSLGAYFSYKPIYHIYESPDYKIPVNMINPNFVRYPRFEIQTYRLLEPLSTRDIDTAHNALNHRADEQINYNNQNIIGNVI